MQSLRRSLRGSFRQRRNSSASRETGHSKGRRPRANSEPNSPIQVSVGQSTDAGSQVLHT